MSQRRSSKHGSRSGSAADDFDNLQGGSYIRVMMKPLEEGSYSVVLGWLGLKSWWAQQKNASANQASHDPCLHALVIPAIVYGFLAIPSSILLYFLFFGSFGSFIQSLIGIAVPVFSIVCAFYWLTLYLRKTWGTTSIYILFCGCFIGESLSHCFCDKSSEHYITQPFLIVGVMMAVSCASLFSTLETKHSALVIIFVTFMRFLACSALSDLPQATRPFIAYASGVVGVVMAKYMETILRPPITNLITRDGRIPVIKRRRHSSTAAHSFLGHPSASRTIRRTSLPAMRQKSQSASAGYESAIIGEAHGLISDMLAETGLPPHVISGLRAVSNLLRTPEVHSASIHNRPKISPLVSLAETSYGSDSDDIPYMGERPSSLPKRLRRTLPPSLLRRMSTSTWTTTTSATGLPTVEPQPCRTRSLSFRHSRDSTPGSSPVGSRSNSPSPSSPTTISLIIPKSRSFSSTILSPVPPGQKHSVSRERRSVYTPPTPPIPESSSSSASSNITIPVPSHQSSGSSPKTDIPPPLSLTKRIITSDYESSDSPSSSEHDNITSAEDTPTKSTGVFKPQLESSISASDDSSGSTVISGDNDTQTTDLSCVPRMGPLYVTVSSADTPESPPSEPVISISTTRTDSSSLSLKTVTPPTLSSDSPSDSRDPLTAVAQVDALIQDLAVQQEQQRKQIQPALLTAEVPFNVEDLQHEDLLAMSLLNQWDYPIFDLATRANSFILSMMSYRLFTESGLFETFRIPTAEFVNYFHALELGYQDKPYHNRIHATDVLHGVYYLTTQAIPGFQQISPDSDLCQRPISSSDSECESVDRSLGCMPFTAEDAYGIMGGNFPPLELMALYTAAAMHDYDHPGRTNAFLVATQAPVAILYNDRSVLENHHAASAWNLYLSNPKYHWLCHLDTAEFKRFRFLVIEAILATDLKRHFELLAEFNSKANDDDAPGIDWTSETDRLMVSYMVIKMADINGPAKKKKLHFSWTSRISTEFYEQGDEEQGLGLPISPYMDRDHPQLAKLQESFVNHLVGPLCNALAEAGLLPGVWVEEMSDSDGGRGSHSRKSKKIQCSLTQNLQDNHDMWLKVIAQDSHQNKDSDECKEGEKDTKKEKMDMETIKEEDTPPNSASGVQTKDCYPALSKPPPTEDSVSKEPNMTECSAEVSSSDPKQE